MSAFKRLSVLIDKRKSTLFLDFFFVLAFYLNKVIIIEIGILL